MDMKIEGFWIACGAVFLAGALWTLVDLPWPLAPILLILLGVVLLGKAITGLGR
jgi:xanthosine utilization system XapX-like protein